VGSLYNSKKLRYLTKVIYLGRHPRFAKGFVIQQDIEGNMQQKKCFVCLGSEVGLNEGESCAAAWRLGVVACVGFAGAPFEAGHSHMVWA
jgi:hypothetical protein